MLTRAHCPISSCHCLNIRVVAVGNADIRVRVEHSTLVDIILKQHETLSYFLVCLLCQTAAIEVCSIEFFGSMEIPLEDPLNLAATPIEFTLPISRSFWTIKARWIYRVLNEEDFHSAKQKFSVFSAAHNVGETPTRAGNFSKNNLQFSWEEDFPQSQLSSDEIGAISNQLTLVTERYLYHLHRQPHTGGLESVAILGQRAQFELESILLCSSLGGSAKHREDSAIRETLTSNINRVKGTLSRLSSKSVSSENNVSGFPIIDFDDLPVEVILQIFEYLSPTHTPGDSTCVAQYLQDRLQFSELSLVCRLWADLIPIFLYRHVVLFGDLQSVEQLLEALSKYNSFVRKITVDDAEKDVASRYRLRCCQQVFDDIIAACPNLVSLEIYGIYQPFEEDTSPINTGELRVMKPNPLDRIQDLVLCYPLTTSAGLSLQPFSVRLRSLVLRQWSGYYDDIEESLDLSSLDTLVLEDVFMRLDAMRSLIFATTTICDGEVVSSLTQFTLVNVGAISKDDILALLQTNGLCLRLSTFKYGSLEKDTNPDPEFPIKVLSLCPSLINFSFVLATPMSAKIFDALPEQLQSLELSMSWLPRSFPRGNDGTVSSYQQFLAYICSRGGQNIRQLSTVRRIAVIGQGIWRVGLFQGDHGLNELRSMCTKRGIDFKSTSRLRVRC